MQAVEQTRQGKDWGPTYCVNFHVVGLPSASTMVPGCVAGDAVHLGKDYFAIGYGRRLCGRRADGQRVGGCKARDGAADVEADRTGDGEVTVTAGAEEGGRGGRSRTRGLYEDIGLRRRACTGGWTVTEQTAEQCGRNRDKAYGCPFGCPGVPLNVGSRSESTSYPKRD
jgi:hypothetical protein